jgi:putative sterol carrier protein
LLEPGTADVSGSVDRFGELLGTRPEPISLGFRITGSATKRLYVDREGFRVTEDAEESLDVEVLANEETWRKIAEGDLSPMAALLAGQLRFRGNVLAASRVVHQLRRNGARRNGKA